MLNGGGVKQGKKGFPNEARGGPPQSKDRKLEGKGERESYNKGRGGQGGVTHLAPFWWTITL